MKLQDHCLRRIRHAHRDFGQDDGKPFVTKIEVKDVTPSDGSDGKEHKKLSAEERGKTKDLSQPTVDKISTCTIVSPPKHEVYRPRKWS
jgi:hypothetical protein